MSLTGKNLEEQLDEKSSDSEENFETVGEGDSDESVSRSVTKLKNMSIQKHRKHFSRNNCGKSHGARLTVSLRHSKHTRQFRAKSKCGKNTSRRTSKKCPGKTQNSPENVVEVPQKGKRCRLGGKAKGMPPQEESCDKYDSDEETDGSYFSRISLGYFQKFRDESGASTSYQRDESYKTPNVLISRAKELSGKTSEERELLELQEWGMSSLVSYTKRTEKLSRDDKIHPDTF